MLKINNVFVNENAIISIEHKPLDVGWFWNTPSKFIIVVQSSSGSVYGSSAFFYGSTQLTTYEVLETNQEAFQIIQDYLKLK